jgi:hypothetical protein
MRPPGNLAALAKTRAGLGAGCAGAWPTDIGGAGERQVIKRRSGEADERRRMVNLRREAAGRSLGRHFKLVRKRWRRRMAPTIILVTTSLLACALLVRLFLPWGPQFNAGVIVGAALVLFLWMWDEPPEVISKWARGAEGERMTAKALRRLPRGSWHVRHDLAARFGNVDHVVVGPGGVFLLDSKNLTGRALVEEGILSLERLGSRAFPLTGLPRSLHGAASGLRDRLAQATGWAADVYPVVVVCNDFPQRRAQAGRLTYVAVGELVDWLLEQPQRVAPNDLEAIAAILRELPAAPDFALAQPAREGESP